MHFGVSSCEQQLGFKQAQHVLKYLLLTHQLLAVLLSCAGAEQLHVEKGKNSQQLWLQVVCLSDSAENSFKLKKEGGRLLVHKIHVCAG